MNEALIKKLRLPQDGKVLVLQSPDGYLPNIGLGEPETLFDQNLTGKYDFVQLFTVTVEELEKYGPQALKAIKPDGLLWLCYPKGSSKLKTDLSRDKGWDIVKAAGFEGVSLVSVDDTWSAMRFRPLEATTRRSGTEQGLLSEQPSIKKPSVVLLVPEDLKELLEKDQSAKTWFEGLAPSHRKAYISWIEEAKREETRTLRLEKTVEKLRLGLKNPSDKG